MTDNPETNPIPRWVSAAAWLAGVLGLVAIALIFAGVLAGARRNVLVQMLAGSLVVLFLLGVYVLRFHRERVRPAPARAACALLVLLALALTGLYAVRVRPILSLRYDLASWSEPLFLAEITKWRAGQSFYLPPDDSNSGVYPPTAALLTYSLAWVAGRPTSIVAYRLIMQLYLGLAALFAAAATANLLRLADPQRFARPSRLWLAFFALVSLLVATTAETNAFNIFLHVDPLATLASAAAFWLVTQYAVTDRPMWLWLMAAAPALLFAVKQYLAVWAVAYLIFLWMDGAHSMRRLAVFAAAAFGGVAVAGLAGYLLWGENYRYWIFSLMGSDFVRFDRISERFADAAWCIAPGFLGALVLLRRLERSRLLGLWASWWVLLIAGVYTSGVTYRPTHYSTATMVAASFALAALVELWPEERERPAATGWFRMVVAMCLVFAFFAGLGFTRRPTQSVSRDFLRYVGAIEKEFEGLPPEQVLLDAGEWFYFKRGVVRKDSALSLLIHREPHYGVLERIRSKHYARILVHEYGDGRYLYETGRRRGIQEVLLDHYREVRRIPAVKDMNNWYAYGMLLSAVVVLEPIPRAGGQQPN
jgi:hypothetical protein